MNSSEWRLAAAVQFFALVPYLVVSWGYSKLSGDSMWAAFGILILVRLFFSIIELLGSVLMWRLYGKRQIVNRWLEVLRSGQFPQSREAGQDFSSYLLEVAEDSSCNEDVRLAARLWYHTLSVYEEQGILIGMRMHAAGEAALEAYLGKHTVSNS